MSYDYRSDIRAINELVQGDSEAFRRMIRFVLATIQQQLETVPVILQDFEDNGVLSRFAFGMKKDGLRASNANLVGLFARAHETKDSPVDLLDTFLQVPGIGLAKAGFCAQLFNNKVGCVDTHNIKLYDVPLQQLRYPKGALPDTRLRYREQYVALTRGLGGSALLWSRWCHYVHRLRPKNWESGGEVSYFHLAVISGEWNIIDDWVYFDLDYAPKFARVEGYDEIV